MDLHDHELDSLITLALQPSPVMPQQKQMAWEQLQARLAEPAAERPVRGVQFFSLIRSAWKSVWSFALEEARYESARQERCAFRYYSLTPASFNLEVMGPLRMSKLGQVC